ncbi:hypothetical protein D3C77_735080 [compost metagenome]
MTGPPSKISIWPLWAKPSALRIFRAGSVFGWALPITAWACSVSRQVYSGWRGMSSAMNDLLPSPDKWSAWLKSI